jgi:hypothetical protein
VVTVVAVGSQWDFLTLAVVAHQLWREFLPVRLMEVAVVAEIVFTAQVVMVVW